MITTAVLPLQPESPEPEHRPPPYLANMSLLSAAISCLAAILLSWIDPIGRFAVCAEENHGLRRRLAVHARALRKSRCLIATLGVQILLGVYMHAERIAVCEDP